MKTEYDIDPATLPAFTIDFMRVEIGLLISRPPIFMTFKERDYEFLKLRTKIMNEYYIDFQQYNNEFEEIAKLNEEVLSNNSYKSVKNVDNYPTHRYVDPVTNDKLEYCAASKHFSKVDPNI